jgi:hypothetical protein
MNLSDILYTVQDLYQNKNGRKLTLEQFNRYLQIANDELKRTLYGLVGDKDGAETEQQILDALLPFKTTASIILTSGTGVLPTDYWHSLKITTNVLKKIKLVTEKEFERRYNCSIDFPTVSEPICYLKTGVTSIVVIPTTIGQCMLTYYKKDTPKLNFKINNGYNDYTSSTELLWGQDKYMDIIRLILGYLNIPLDNNTIQYVEQKTQQMN